MGIKKKLVIVLIAVIFLALIFVLVREPHIVSIFRHGSQAEAQFPCGASLWKYNAEEENILKSCVTISGVVVSRNAEDDGDENIQLKPDPEYVHLLNVWNIFGQWGNIAVEAICENHPSKDNFRKACKGYKSQVILPHVGDHISVTGSYGIDKHGWTEIHPVTKIIMIRQ